MIECKYPTDINILDTINNIHNIYAPLKQALQLHNKRKLEVQIITIDISRTSTFRTRTLAKIAQLVSFKENPPYTLTYKTLPKKETNSHGTTRTHTRMLAIMSEILKSIINHPHKLSKSANHNKNRL